jgi:hypothetical protein
MHLHSFFLRIADHGAMPLPLLLPLTMALHAASSLWLIVADVALDGMRSMPLHALVWLIVACSTAWKDPLFLSRYQLN